ncbi:MAG: cytochrome c oxidase assembly protein [Candidatus Methylumidiphilus sp.]
MAVIASLMFGLGFAIAPYYDAICEWSGIGGRVKEASANTAYSVDQSREITVEFVTAVNGDMPLEFRAETTKLKVHPGQYYTVNFYAENTSDKKRIGRAIPSISPVWASGQFKKTECFCFSEQEFEPHKGRQLPVRFVIDPAVAADISEMALAYTFFDITEKTQTIKK